VNTSVESQQKKLKSAIMAENIKTRYLSQSFAIKPLFRLEPEKEKSSPNKKVKKLSIKAPKRKKNPFCFTDRALKSKNIYGLIDSSIDLKMLSGLDASNLISKSFS
tara:strand:+ start:939 stop:1256 length:318 start_codon:yes stop_codon:yes gene_type:complete